jgi:nitrite reductase/ring-hydroxylating ferredoxin subunit
MVLKELASSCWSQPASSQGFHPRAGAGLLVQRLLPLLLWPEQEAGRRVEARCGHEGLQTLLSSGHGPGYMVMCPCHGWPRCVGPAVGTIRAVV